MRSELGASSKSGDWAGGRALADTTSMGRADRRARWCGSAVAAPAARSPELGQGSLDDQEHDQPDVERYPVERIHVLGVGRSALSGVTGPATAGAAAVLIGRSACGGGIQVSDEQPPMRRAAEVFYQRCSGCHSLDFADAQGSANSGNFASEEHTKGPNFKFAT
jgi:hypothetical protein